MTKIRSICVDTLTSIQQEEYMTAIGKPGFDEWMDKKPYLCPLKIG